MDCPDTRQVYTTTTLFHFERLIGPSNSQQNISLELKYHVLLPLNLEYPILLPLSLRAAKLKMCWLKWL